MSRVFLAEKSTRFPLDAAKQWGQLVFLSEARLSPFQTERTVRTFTEALEQHQFDPFNDYVCMTGGALGVAYMLAVVAHLYPQVKLLLFDAQTSTYAERIFSVRTAEVIHESQQHTDNVIDGIAKHLAG